MKLVYLMCNSLFYYQHILVHNNKGWSHSSSKNMITDCYNYILILQQTDDPDEKQ